MNTTATTSGNESCENPSKDKHTYCTHALYNLSSSSLAARFPVSVCYSQTAKRQPNGSADPSTHSAFRLLHAAKPKPAHQHALVEPLRHQLLLRIVGVFVVDSVVLDRLWLLLLLLFQVRFCLALLQLLRLLLRERFGFRLGFRLGLRFGLRFCLRVLPAGVVV